MNYIKWYYKSFKWQDFLKHLLSAVGAEVTLLKILNFLYEDFLQTHKACFSCITYSAALIYAIVRTVPKKSISCKISDKDIKIEIKIGDIFKNDSKTWIVVPIDTRFEVGLKEGNNLKLSKSVLACVVNQYFSGQSELLQGLIDNKKGDKSSIGDVVKVFHENKTFLFLANTVKVENSDKVKQDRNTLHDSLSGLWDSLKEFCENETLAIPLLNTGYAGNHNTRLDVITEIIQSFIASLQSGNVYCSHLIISISEQDFYQHLQNDFSKAEAYLKYICSFYGKLKIGKHIVKAEPSIRTL